MTRAGYARARSVDASVPSEEDFRRAALAAFENARSLHEEAVCLVENGYPARAVALAVIGLEELAKAIVYTMGALLPAERRMLMDRMRVLGDHKAKHLIALAAEVAQISTADAIAALRQATGEPVVGHDFLVILFRELVRQGVSKLVGNREQAVTFYREFSDTRPSDPTLIHETQLKNAALYVDLTAAGEVLTPERTHSAAGQVLGLRWFFAQYGWLPHALTDDLEWKRFAAAVRGYLRYPNPSAPAVGASFQAPFIVSTVLLHGPVPYCGQVLTLAARPNGTHSK